MMSMWTRVALLCFSLLAVICQDCVATSPPEFQHHHVFSSVADLKEKLENDSKLQEFFVNNLHPGEHATVITTISAGCPETTATMPISIEALGEPHGDDTQTITNLKLLSTTTKTAITSDETTTTHVHVPNTTKISTTSEAHVTLTENAITWDETPTTNVHDPETTKIATTSGVSATTPGSIHPPETTPQATTTGVATTVESITCEAPDGWNCWPYGNRNLTYKFFNQTKMNYKQANKICSECDGRLTATIIRDFTKENREEYLPKGVAYWIGLQDTAKEGEFVWADGGEYNERKTPWGVDQPDNHCHESKGKDEDCVHVRLEDGMLNDALCSDKHMFVCEKEIGN